MQGLLKFSNGIDRFNTWINRYVIWLILGATLISAINALVRKIFNNSSNAFLEVQWYLFAASFLLASCYTLLQNEHVKIDVIYSRFDRQTQNKIDIFGFAFFMLPMCTAVMWFGVPFFWKGLVTSEMSSNAGGLIRWPVYAMIPLGFGLLWLQGASELIKRIAFAKGLISDPTLKEGEKSAEEELAEEIRKLAEAKAQSSKV